MPELTFFRSVYSLEDIPATGLPEICISGRSNVGKSSLLNRLANRRNLARISQTPGKTQSINYYSADGGFYLVDLPGYGYAKLPKSRRKTFSQLVDTYLGGRRELIGIIQLIDSRHGPVTGDFDMLEWVKNWNGSILYVFTKADKLTANERAKRKNMFAKEFSAENYVMFSARTRMGVNDIWAWINKTLGI